MGDGDVEDRRPAAERPSRAKHCAMTTYFVVNGTIKDAALLDEYLAAAGATLGIVPLKLLTADAACEVVEGTPAGTRTVILEFASKDDFRTWYDSPAYQAIIGKRLAATQGFGLLAEGLPGAS
jgi:uncharacterized protein (DUF1330 family)